MADETIPGDAPCAWEQELIHHGGFMFVRDDASHYWVEIDLEPIYQNAILAGHASVTTENGEVKRYFVAHTSQGEFSIGTLEGRDRAFEFKVHEVLYHLVTDDLNQTSSDLAHNLERHEWQEWDFLVWAVDGPDGPYRFLQTVESEYYGERHFEPGTFSIAGSDFWIGFDSRQMFWGTAGYTASDPLPLIGEGDSPVCD